MNKIDNKLTKLNDQLKTLKSQINQINNVKREREEKLLIRKQIIIGKMVINEMNTSDEYKSEILEQLIKSTLNTKECELFGLKNTKQITKQTKHSSLIKLMST